MANPNPNHIDLEDREALNIAFLKSAFMLMDDVLTILCTAIFYICLPLIILLLATMDRTGVTTERERHEARVREGLRRLEREMERRRGWTWREVWDAVWN
ncbi:hypothetical protein CLAFUW4_03204 [Fulvia fulva]|uniref:Uncharacterized protein n=1 Tax=Passalora fulva TaxID=5499 RepID=A0A9Q8LB77_PASFU|nr:uncharacterized protein CLAFUR5_03188 [Fulvia fulva]KAK4632325.1 hypothetical protein CLAFUR4_03193 [Fulvia fulva]KAK4633706.1 hypothetical protein CLAFUR0_03197 [Fulvia fulva]UJO14227.1 hypothetical protein CLAFUR5_03188 [Fulvia fulva]WPV11114.1 hypothetical protein CLAFUW4_03204 [Fulvia fulva]WPV26261.1 hypothetical protein CLAFUW7_03197 [Fulvia fulva]